MIPNHRSNVRQGTFPILANADLTGKEAQLAVIVNSSGTPKAALPSSTDDLAVYQIDEGGGSGETVHLRPIEQGKQYRVPLKGTCVPGDKLSLAASTDLGKVRKMPGTAGTYRTLFIAEEAGVDGQLVLARACLLEPVTIS